MNPEPLEAGISWLVRGDLHRNKAVEEGQGLGNPDIVRHRKHPIYQPEPQEFSQALSLSLSISILSYRMSRPSLLSTNQNRVPRHCFLLHIEPE